MRTLSSNKNDVSKKYGIKAGRPYKTTRKAVTQGFLTLPVLLVKN
jgi:hypothetical protein